MCLSVKSADSGMCSGAHTDVLCVCTYLCRHIETKHWRDEPHRTSTRWPLGNDEPVLFFSEFLHRESVGAMGWGVGRQSCPVPGLMLVTSHALPQEPGLHMNCGHSCFGSWSVGADILISVP